MRVRILQIIAALITIGIMVVLHDLLGAFLHWLDPKFMMGLVTGAVGATAFFVALMLWERRTLARREQQGARHLIDL